MNKEQSEDSTLVGVIGIGDLGTRLVAQLLSAQCEVLAFDAAKTNISVSLLDKAVDPARNVHELSDELLYQAKMSDILKVCKIVHWAVPSSKLADLPVVPQDCTVVLHDSVMANSIEAIERRSDSEQFVAAHCLMNEAKRVFVSTEFGDHAAVFSHFEKIGLCPKQTTVKAHDTLMARTQGVFALLIDLGIRSELDKDFDEGDLTPSAIELRSAVTNREANWTAQTLQSILGNPELVPFVHEMANTVAKTL